MSSGRHGKHDEFERLLGTAHRGGMPEPAACPDPATIAAYMDNSLDAGERTAFEHHAADCPHCAEAIALLAGLDEAPELHATTPRTAASSWWRWLVPVATVVLVLIVWRELPRRESATPASDTSGPAPAAAAPSASPDRQATSSPQREDAKASAAPSARKPAALSKEQQRSKQEGDRRQAYSAPLSAAKPEAAAAPQGQPPVSQRSAREPRNEAVTVERAPASPAGAADADARTKSTSNRPGSLPAPPHVTSADGAAHYRVVEERIVQRSIDGGRTWVTEATPAAAGLRVGSAPSRDVCWFAGADGVVLRRGPDGTWQVASLPQRMEIVGITATTATAAVVTTAAGGRWQTIDGGRQWQPLTEGL
jgi:hypothetical protein